MSLFQYKSDPQTVLNPDIYKNLFFFVLQAEHNTKANTELDNEWWPKIKVVYIL